MQADGRLVEHVEDAGQPAAELRREPHPLHLAAAQGVRSAPEAEVAEAHLFEERQSTRRFAQGRLGDGSLATVELDLAKGRDGFRHALIEQHRDRHLIDGHTARQRREAGLVALVAELALHRAFAPAPSPLLLDDFAAPLAGGALALPRVEGEEAGVELRVAAPTARAGTRARELHLVAARDGPGGPVAGLEGPFEELEQLGALRRDPADHELDVVFGVAVELHAGLELADLAVDARLAEPILLRFGEQLAMDALSPADDRREQGHLLRPEAALHVACELRRGACRNGHLAIDAMQDPDARPNQTKVVRDLGDRRDRRVRPRARHALLERHARRNADDLIDRRPRELRHVLTGVGRKCFEVAALPFGEQDVEGERALSASARPRDDHELVARNLDAHVLEVVFARVGDANLAKWLGSLPRLLARGCRFRLPLAERAREVRRGLRALLPDDLLRRTLGDDAAALIARARSQVDHVVRVRGHLHVVLDDDDRVASLDEVVEDLHQRRDVVRVEASRGFVEHDERPRHGADQGLGELEPLRLATRERVEGLPKPQVAEPDVQHRSKRLRDRLVVGEVLGGLLGRELEHVRDVHVFVLHVEHGADEAPPLALGAAEDDVREELHLDRLGAVAATGLAAPASDVEGEDPGFVSALLGQACRRKALSEHIPNLEVSRGVAARSSAERSLIDPDDAVQRGEALDVVVLERRPIRLEAELALDRRQQGLEHEAALAGAAHAGDAGQRAPREGDVVLAEVVPGRPGELDPSARLASPALHHPVRLQRGCGGRLRPLERSRRAVEDNLAAVLSGARPELDDPIRAQNHFGVVLDDDRDVLVLRERAYHPEQALDIARMKADRRLVEDEHRPIEGRPERTRQRHALRLAA